MANDRLRGLLSFDPDDPNSQGLLGLGAALLQASGPSREPVSMGQALGQGLQGMQQARQHAIQQQMAAARMGAGHGQPSTVQEWEYFNKLSPQDQARFLEMKRNPNIMNLGGEFAVRSPGGGIGERYTVSPKPEQMPQFQGAQERAKAKEKAAVEMETDLAKKGVKAESMTDLIGEARSILNDASGSYAGSALSAAKGAIGISDKETQANRQLKLIGGWMVSNVPRMEGPQSDFDVKNYREMAATVGDSTVPIKDRLAALDVLEKLQAKYAGGNAPAKPAATGGIQFLGFE